MLFFKTKSKKFPPNPKNIKTESTAHVIVATLFVQRRTAYCTPAKLASFRSRGK